MEERGKVIRLDDYRDGAEAGKKLALAQSREVALQIGELRAYHELFEHLIEKGTCPAAVLVRSVSLQIVALQDFIARGVLFLRRLRVSGPAATEEVRAYLLDTAALIDDSKKLFEDVLRSTD